MKTIADGVWPVMITPYTEDNKIDYDAVLRIIEWYDKQGVDGIFAVCQSSEMFFLDKKERLELAKFVVENTPKHIGVIASGHVAKEREDQIEEAKAIIDAGVDSYVFISNQFAKPDESEDVAKKNIEYMIDNIPCDSFGIYECPYPYKRLVAPETLKWCAETGKFAFLKDTCCDLDGLKAKSLKMGCSGFSGVMANFHADMYGWLCKNFKEQPEKAELMQAFLGFASVIECQVYPVNAKYHMNLEGVPMTLNCRNKDKNDLTGSRKLEVEQLHTLYKHMRKEFFN